MAVKGHNGGRPRSPQKNGAPMPPAGTGGMPRGQKRQPAPRRNSPRNAPQGMPPRDNAPMRPSHGAPRPDMRAQRAAADAMHSRKPRREKRRHGRRGRNYTYYYILAFIVFAIVFIVLANTVLFRCASFEVEGAARYSAEEIIAASGLKKGDNLLHISAEKSESAVERTLSYIDSAKVKKRFPTKIKITVVESEKWYLVEDNSGCAVVSRGGKIIDSERDESLVKVIGYEPAALDVGGRISSAVEGKNGIPEAILEAADKAGLAGIKEIDISDRFAIILNYQDRVMLELGNISDIEKKLNVAAGVIETQIAPTEEVALNLIDPDVVVCRALNTGAGDEGLPEIANSTEETAQSEAAAESSENA